MPCPAVLKTEINLPTDVGCLRRSAFHFRLARPWESQPVVAAWRAYADETFILRRDVGFFSTDQMR